MVIGNLRVRGSVLGLLLSASVSCAFGQEAAKGLSEKGQQKLATIIAAAQKEGKLSFVFPEGALGGAGAQLAKGFNAYYGTNLDVRFTPGPPMPNIAGQVIQQLKANRPAVTDVVMGYANHMTTLLQAEALEKVDWAEWAANLQNSALVHGGGAAIPIQTSTPGIAYNVKAVKPADVPQKFADFLDPKWKGRIATTPYASSYDRLAANLWGRERTFDFTRALSKQVGGLIRCNELERIASGEFDAFGMTCSQNIGARAASKGGPIGFTLVSDVPIVMYVYLGIPANSTHPAASKLWVNYLLTPEAQKTLFDNDDQDLHLLPASGTGVAVKEQEAKGTKFLKIDIDYYKDANTSQFESDLQEVQKILRGG